MKTRREFLKLLGKGTVVLAAVAVAPVSLATAAKPKENLFGGAAGGGKSDALNIQLREWWSKTAIDNLSPDYLVCSDDFLLEYHKVALKSYMKNSPLI